MNHFFPHANLNELLEEFKEDVQRSYKEYENKTSGISGKIRKFLLVEYKTFSDYILHDLGKYQNSLTKNHPIHHVVALEVAKELRLRDVEPADVIKNPDRFRKMCEERFNKYLESLDKIISSESH